MTLEDLRRLLAECPLIASSQADEGTPLDDPATLAACAQASGDRGVRLLRMQGVRNIEAGRARTGLPTIGLIKRSYPGSDVYITPTQKEVEAILATGSEIVALDGTGRPRPHGEKLEDLVRHIHQAGRLAMADCDGELSLRLAHSAGADILSTTLSGYTEFSQTKSQGPDLALVRWARDLGAVLIAEGRYAEPWQAQAALRAGADGVVIGGALNDPRKQTQRFLDAVRPAAGPVGAVDLGGTWLRFGVFSPDWTLQTVERTPTPESRSERLMWVREQADKFGIQTIGIGSGGTIDPDANTVVESKPWIPDHLNTLFDWPGLRSRALNDGLATAWGHACLPENAGLRVATLALGTGVGCGLVDRGKLFMGPLGGYPRLNDLKLANGRTVEDVLGGLGLAGGDDPQARRLAIEAAKSAIALIGALWMPDRLVVCGGVGLSDWMQAALGEGEEGPPVAFSPFGSDAGLFGAAALVLFPPQP